ncbi:MAG: hypothetical protein E4H13_00210 [Calditrichales bacterium]|nr:MAG: hypothetical protein E4H13_00210 [Calditrichales bacterium]
MKFEADQILKQLEPTVKSAIQDTFILWQKYHKDRTFEIQSILNAFKILLVHTDSWAQNPHALWEELEKEILNIRHWTNSIEYVNDADVSEKITVPLTTALEARVSEYPGELRILINESYWQIQESDPIVSRIRKKWQPLKLRLIQKRHDMRNRYRDFRDKPPVSAKPEERIIQLHPLLWFYIKNPLIQFLIQEWQKYLQAISGQLSVLHLNLKEFTNKSLILEDLPRVLNPEEKNDIFSSLFELAEILKNIDETLQSLDKYDNSFMVRFDQRWKEISKTFLIAWGRAGSFQLKSKAYGGERLTHLEYSSTNRLKKHAALWQQHFNALRGDWQKDTEISLLRYKVVRNLLVTANLLNEGVYGKIEPFFTRVKDSLNLTTEQLSKVADESAFREVVSVQRKTILNDLQELLENIHSVHIVNLLKNNLQQLESGADSLGEEYISFIRKDADRLPPHSVTDIIPLQELVKKEIFNPLREKYLHTIRDIEIKVEYILRVISEIDQLIEFNSNSVFKLIDQSGDLPVFERARNEFSEGLSRASKLTVSLQNEMATMPALCVGDLLKYGLELETDLEKFLVAEKLSRFKIQLKRKKRQEKNVRFFKKITGFYNRIFIFIFKDSIKFISHIWIQYFSPNPDLAKNGNGNGEKTQRYLKQTELRIASLPFIYQKLFHIDSLKDDQFFSGRKREIDHIKNEYSRWKQKQRNAVAIIGERGSGLTTFVHFIERAFSEEQEPVKIFFEQPLNSDREIFIRIREALRCSNAGDWQALESEVRENQAQQICVLENIHYLYLKTINGFKGLENLLHFMSSTQDVIFWISTCTLYSWRFLEKAIQINTYFSKPVTLHNISPEELKSIILRRHRASGYHLNFDYPESGSKPVHSVKAGTGSSVLTEQINLYFEKLHQQAAGNIRTAILIWLRSIKHFSKDQMTLSFDFNFDFDFLMRLQTEEIFTLGAILHQEILSAENHALIFNQSREKSHMNLEKLFQTGLLMKTDAGYHIHPFIYRPLVQTLVKLNIIT